MPAARACRLDLSDCHVRRSSHGKFSVADCIAHLTGQRAGTGHRRYVELSERGVVPECERHVLLTPTGGLGSDKLEPVGSPEELYKIVAALDDDGAFRRLGLTLEWSSPCRDMKRARVHKVADPSVLVANELVGYDKAFPESKLDLEGLSVRRAPDGKVPLFEALATLAPPHNRLLPIYYKLRKLGTVQACEKRVMNPGAANVRTLVASPEELYTIVIAMVKDGAFRGLPLRWSVTGPNTVRVCAREDGDDTPLTKRPGWTSSAWTPWRSCA